MDDLLIFLNGLLVSDDALRDLFAAAGCPVVEVIPPRQRHTAAYPRIVLDGDEGGALEWGENAAPKFVDGRVRLEIVTRESPDCPLPLGTLRAIQERATALILGDDALGLVPVKGRRISPTRTVTRLSQVRPTGPVPVTDPIYCRHLTTFSVQIMRTS